MGEGGGVVGFMRLRRGGKFLWRGDNEVILLAGDFEVITAVGGEQGWGGLD